MSTINRTTLLASVLLPLALPAVAKADVCWGQSPLFTIDNRLPGACCALDGTCTLMKEEDCAEMPLHVYHGDGTTCDPNPCAVCGDGTCEGIEDPCNCPQDCGDPPANEQPGITCTDGIDNDCDEYADCDDNDCAYDPDCACASDEDCYDGDYCTVDTCTGVCSYEPLGPRPYADVYPVPDGDGAVEIMDTLCILDAAGGLGDCLTDVGGYMLGDIYPCPPPEGTGPDGAVEIMDTLSVLDAASGAPGCAAWCP